MRRHLIWFLLALSVLFNVFFLVGYSNARARVIQAPASGDVSGRRIAAALELDESQQAVFDQLHQSMQDESQSLRDAMVLARQQLADELDRPEPDIECVRATVEQISQLQQQHRAAALARFSTFMGCLSDDQYRKLGRRMGAPGHRNPRDRHRMPLKRFDIDNNGVLDAEERAQAEVHMEARRQERQQRHRELEERFDVNRDGRLDEQERQELRKWLGANPPERRSNKPPPSPTSPPVS